MIGHRVKEIRVKKKIRPIDIARELGMTKQAYHRFERLGRYIDGNKVLPLAKILKVNPKELFVGLGSNGRKS